MAATKEFEKAWRPVQHLVCCLVPGLVEMFFLLRSGLAQDSNMQATLLSHALDVVMQLLAKRNRKMPQHLHVQADNTSREMRNQFMFQWGALLVATGKFRSVSFAFLPVGHTHIDVDQRFSSIATYLSRQHILETPQDRLCHACVVRRFRAIHVCIVQGTRLDTLTVFRAGLHTEHPHALGN